MCEARGVFIFTSAPAPNKDSVIIFGDRDKGMVAW
jgi:hypothetical protein